MLGATDCGTSTNTRTGSVATSVNIGVVPFSWTSEPRSTERVVIVPANGAVTFAKLFVSTRRFRFASCAVTLLSAALTFASPVCASDCCCSTCACATSFWPASVS